MGNFGELKDRGRLETASEDLAVLIAELLIREDQIVLVIPPGQSSAEKYVIEIGQWKS